MKETLTHQVYNTFKSDLSTAIHRNEFSAKHFHKNAELLICVRGTCQCQINNQDYRLSQGQAVFICPLQVHSFTVSEDSAIRRITYHEHLILTISKSLMGRVPQNPVFRANPKILQFCLDFLNDCFGEEACNLKRVEPFEKRMEIKGVLHLLGGEFLSRATLIQTPKVDNFALEIFQYITDNFERDVSLKEIAAQRGYNYQYASRIFNRYLDMNFKQVLNQYRAQQAFALLQDTDLPVSHIGLACGFQSIRSFNQICRDIFGKTPTQLRNSAKITPQQAP
ncbi:MAG: helix-turn-helix transcriptional regulator [Clostridia bacterium]|nr:helix-turn-helix transcriptional regulator [Clostridia bacterium]